MKLLEYTLRKAALVLILLNLLVACSSGSTDPKIENDSSLVLADADNHDQAPLTIANDSTLADVGNLQQAPLTAESLQASEPILAFPGALGYAKYARGGRLGRVLIVNTVANIVDPNDAYLSLREAVEVETGPRTIVFEVGGLFDTGKKLLNLKAEEGSNVTIACQSAPAPGVILKTYGFNVSGSAHDIVMRHCAVRGIDVGDGSAKAGRSITIRGGSRNIILDHMSFSWSTDEGFQAYLDNNQTQGLENITLSNSIVAEGDADSSHPESIEHPEWRYHSMGPSCLNNSTQFRPTNCSLVNNFVAHNASRNVMIWGGAGEMSNNIIYNWYSVGLTARTYTSNSVDAIVNNNLMKSGPDTVGVKDNPGCEPLRLKCALALGKTDRHGTAKYSVGNNYYIPEYLTIAEAELIENPNANTPDGKPEFSHASPSPVDIREMAAKGSQHMRCVGASRPTRDAVDTRLIQEFYDGTGAVGIGENIRSGGHNVFPQRTWELFGEPTFHPPGFDTDQDGMQDSWELLNGLNPQDPNDHAGDIDGDGYTNIEEFLATAAAC